MDEQNFKDIISKMNEGLDKMDDAFDIPTPDISRFRKLVVDVGEKKQKRRLLETLIFMLGAMCFLAIEAYIFSRSTTLFILFQAASLALLPVSIYLSKKQGSRKVDVYER